MRKALLLAAEHLREQRWAIAALLTYVFLMAAAYGLSEAPSSEELLLFVRQQASFAVLFTLFLSASVLHAERRSKRILAVLSKAISRRMYVRSILLAMWIAAAIYTIASCIGLAWIARYSSSVSRIHYEYLWMAFVAALATAAVAVFFSTFLHPLVATFASAVLIVVPAYLGQFAATWLHLSPASALMANSTGLVVLAGASSLRYWITLTLVQTVVFWAGAAYLFTKLDVAVPVE